jgi:hypothetical protein
MIGSISETRLPSPFPTGCFCVRNNIESWYFKITRRASLYFISTGDLSDGEHFLIESICRAGSGLRVTVLIPSNGLKREYLLRAKNHRNISCYITEKDKWARKASPRKDGGLLELWRSADKQSPAQVKIIHMKGGSRVIQVWDELRRRRIPRRLRRCSENQIEFTMRFEGQPEFIRFKMSVLSKGNATVELQSRYSLKKM